MSTPLTSSASTALQHISSRRLLSAMTVSFEQVKILDVEAGGFDWGRGEIYVVTSILDGSGSQPDFKTQLFQGIRDGDLLPLGSGGMLVGFLENPRWFVDPRAASAASRTPTWRTGSIS